MMKFLNNVKNFLKKAYQWYQEPIPGHRLIRTDPITVALIIMFIGSLASIHQFIQGAQQMDESKDVADQWRSASTEYQEQIENAYNENKISGYEREVALQRLDEMSPIFIDVANAIETEGQENMENAAYQGLVDSALNLVPFSQLGGGTLVGVAGIGDLYTAYGLGNYVDTLGQSPFSEDQEALINVGNILITNTQPPPTEEQSQINQEIIAVLGDDADDLFMARIRTQINLIRRWYIEYLEKSPCNSEQVLTNYRAELIELGWMKESGLFGEGEKWPSYEAFIDWLIIQARGIEGEDIAISMSGDFSMTNTATQICTVCTPPTISGTIELTINLETCNVSGTLTGTGTGTASTTCVYEEEEERVYTATGTASFSGDLSGSADKNGALSLDNTTVLFDYSWNFIDGGSQGGDAGQANVELILTGQIDWSDSAAGTIEFITTGECAIVGDWSAKTD
jgi:hypothetical protein